MSTGKTFEPQTDVWMIALEDSRAGLAPARLVSIENTRGNYEGAYDAANRFIEGFGP